MSLIEDLAVIMKQERVLQFKNFDEQTAWQLGSLLYDRAASNNWPLAIQISSFDRVLFFAARPGVTFDNHEWVRRKVNTVKRFLCSSYRITHQLAQEEKTLAKHYHLSQADYADCGGGFPLILEGAGVIGSIVVSGLPDRQDHQIIVDALCELLGHDHLELALAADSAV